MSGRAPEEQKYMYSERSWLLTEQVLKKLKNKMFVQKSIAAAIILIFTFFYESHGEYFLFNKFSYNFIYLK